MSVLTSPVLALNKLVDVDAHEGPVYVESEHALYFTTLPKPGAEVAIKRLDIGAATFVAGVGDGDLYSPSLRGTSPVETSGRAVAAARTFAPKRTADADLALDGPAALFQQHPSN
jgi:hypothetical protein